MIELRFDMLDKKAKAPSWWKNYIDEFGEWKRTIAPKTSQDFVKEYSEYVGIAFASVSDSDVNPATGKATYWFTVFTFPTEEDRTAFLLKYS